MLGRLTALFTAIIVCLIPAYQAAAGPVFEDILNTMQIDQKLQRSGDDFTVITHEKPLGQTFATGDSIVQICHIALRVANWSGNWKPDESLIVTMYDSPNKKTAIAKAGIAHKHRHWSDGLLMFAVEAKVKPKQQYYFEISIEGGNDNKADILLSKVNIEYANGKGYEGGKPMDRNIWFETYVKKTADKNALYTEFFDNFNLDYTGMEKIKTSVSAKDWETACKEFLTYMESKRGIMPDEDATPRLDPTADTREADLVADMKWPAIDGSVVDLGPNWNYHVSWPTLGGVGLTRTGLMKPLAFTYTKTGNEKYARAWNSMLISLFRNIPSPEKSGALPTEGRLRHTVPSGISGSMWDAISIAARLHHETFYNRFRNTPLFEPDVRMAWWSNLTDMANILERMDTGGNWTTQVTSSLFGFAQKYPEYKKSKDWFKLGFDGLKDNFIANMYPDGPCKEATTNYHGFSLGMFFGTFKQAQDIGLEVPKEHWDILERSFEYNMYITQPNWQTPIWGDSNRPMDASGMIAGGAKYFNRDDMLWVSTRGKEGKKPSKTSIAFPTAGYYIMRSGWDPKARFLMTRNGVSHGHHHADNLSVILNAYGTDLLPDPGVYAYGTPECNELVQTKSHSTISVDGKDIISGGNPSTWISMPGFDYFDGTSPGYQDISGVKHQRSILFMQPDYWVVADRISGSGEHSAVQYWHFAPGIVEMDTDGIARTMNTAGGNLAILPLYAVGRKDRLRKDLYALNWEQVVKDAPVMKYERSGTLPQAFCTVLYPYPVGKTVNVKAKDLVCDDASLGIAVLGAQVSTAQSTDFIVFNTANKQANLNNGKLGVAAESAFIRISTANDRVAKFGMCNGTSLVFDGIVLASSKTPVKALRVYRDGDTVVVDAEGSTNSLSILTMGAKQARVNGKMIRLAEEANTFKPFETLH